MNVRNQLRQPRKPLELSTWLDRVTTPCRHSTLLPTKRPRPRLSFEILEDRTLPSVAAGPIVNPANGHSYLLLSPSTWTAAEAESVSLGGSLATIDDAAENQWV